jgi:hypothetical protein
VFIWSLGRQTRPRRAHAVKPSPEPA